MKKKLLLLAALITASMLIASCGGNDDGSSLVDGESNTAATSSESAGETEASGETDAASENASSSDSSSESASSEEQVQVTPTFMFFSSKSDSDYDATMAAVSELQQSYGDKIKFDLIDIDENPEAKENFPVEGQTPVLIMLNTSNDISAFEMKITDKSKMEDAIKNALGE